MGISTEQWRISIGSFTPSSHRSKPERLQQNPSTIDYKYIMRPVAHILLALLVALSLMSALTGINILSKGFNPTLSIPFQSTKTLYKQSILIDMDIQSEPTLLGSVFLFLCATCELIVYAVSSLSALASRCFFFSFKMNEHL